MYCAASRGLKMRFAKIQNTIIFFAVFCIISRECFGALVVEEKCLCPVCDKEIAVLGVVSFGSYVYEYESKYDLIFFPYDDPGFIWMCPHCGYAQAAKYFTVLSQKEKNRLKDFLSAKWKPASPNDISIKGPNDVSAIETRFNQAILVNKFLEKDDNFWAWFNRVLIFHYRKIDTEKAKTLAIVERELLQKNKGEFESPKKQRAYLLGEYNRLIGDNKLAQKYFYQALEADAVSEIRTLNTVLVVINFALFVLLLVLWISRGLKKETRIVCTIGGIIIFVLCSFSLYMMPKIIPHYENMNNYHNEIIYDRIKLLNTQPE